MNLVSWSPQSRHWMAGVVAAVGACLMFGFVQQVRVEALLTQTQQAREGEALAYLIERDTVATTGLETQVHQLAAKIGHIGSVNPKAQNLTQNMTLAGLIPVEGPGVVVTLADSPAPTFPGEPTEMQLVHDEYLLHIVGLLMANGATALSISGQRFVSSTAVFCSGPTVDVNGVTSGSPFVIDAVGDATAMDAALKQDPEVQGWSNLVQIHYKTSAAVSVPAYTATPVFRYLDPAAKTS